MLRDCSSASRNDDSRIKEGSIRLRVRALGASVMLAISLTGCDKPPTWNELVGNKSEPAADPAPTIVQPAQPVAETSGGPAVPMPSPAKRDPALVIAHFKQSPTHEISDASLEALASLESGLEQLDKLQLSNPRLSNEGTKHLPKLTGVVDLILSGMSLTTETLQHVGQMTQLERLSMDTALLPSSGLNGLEELVNLKELNISHLSISDASFATFAKMVNLEVLRVSHTPITGAGFQVFDKMGAANSLRIIEANHTQFGANGFVHIKGWKQLEELHVGQAAVSDQGLLLGMKGLTNLRRIDLSFNQLSDFGVRQLVPLRKLEYVALRNTGGPSDQGISLLKNLKELKTLDIEGTAASAQVALFLKKQIPEVKVIVGGQTY